MELPSGVNVTFPCRYTVPHRFLKTKLAFMDVLVKAFPSPDYYLQLRQSKIYKLRSAGFTCPYVALASHGVIHARLSRIMPCAWAACSGMRLSARVAGYYSPNE